MTMQYFTPWDKRQKAPAALIEARTAHCAVLGLPPNAPANAYQLARAALGEADLQAMLQQGELAAKQWEQMVNWSPLPAANTSVGPVLEAMESGLYEYLFLLGGRAGGKSHEVAEAIVDLCSRMKKRVVCGREFMASIKDSNKTLLANKIKEHRSAADWEILDTEIRHKNGTLITFIGVARNVDSAKSLEGCDIFWGEEAQTFSAKSVEIIVPTIRTEGAMLVFTMNPRYEDDPVCAMAIDPDQRPDAAWVKVVQFEDNPYLFRSRLMNDLRKSFRTSKRFRHVWRGDYDTNSELRIIDAKVGTPPIIAPHSGKVMYGIDFGGTDPTSLVRVTHYPSEALANGAKRGVLHITAEFNSPCRSNSDIVDAVEAVCPELVNDGYLYLKADSADPKAIGELNNAGITTIGAVKGPDSVLGGLRSIADFDVWIAPHCTETAKAAERFHWKTDRNGRPTNIPEHEYSHLWDAVRYAIEGEDLKDREGGVGYIILGEAPEE